jgi:hypothetical protein
MAMISSANDSPQYDMSLRVDKLSEPTLLFK